jgi:chromosome segregation ATPase
VNPLNSSLNVQSHQLKSDLQEREQKVKELKSVIEQLENKMTQKNKDLEVEIADKNRFKTKYEEAMEKIAKLEAQIENGIPASKK